MVDLEGGLQSQASNTACENARGLVGRVQSKLKESHRAVQSSGPTAAGGTAGRDVPPCYEAELVNEKEGLRRVEARRRFRFVRREAPFLEFPPNACRGERCGDWGRTAPIKLVRAFQG
jgi:hypothetical protein